MTNCRRCFCTKVMNGSIRGKTQGLQMTYGWKMNILRRFFFQWKDEYSKSDPPDLGIIIGVGTSWFSQIYLVILKYDILIYKCYPARLYTVVSRRLKHTQLHLGQESTFEGKFEAVLLLQLRTLHQALCGPHAPLSPGNPKISSWTHGRVNSMV